MVKDLGNLDMALGIRDLEDLKRLLVEHPEWRMQIRDVLVAADIEALHATMDSLAEMVKDLGKRVQALTENFDRIGAWFAEFVRRSDERMGRLEADVAVLKTDGAEMKADIAVLKTDVAVLKTDVAVLKTDVAVLKTDVAVLKTDGAEMKADIAVLKTDVGVLKTDVGGLKGSDLERKYRENAPSYFGAWLRRTRAVNKELLAEQLEGRLSDDEFEDLLRVDLVVRGRPKRGPAGEEIWLAVEISVTVNPEDVTRAVKRSGFLRRAGYRSVPVVAGDTVTPAAEAEARSQSVAVLKDGTSSLWEQALAAWAS
jgi:cell division protein FtsB